MNSEVFPLLLTGLIMIIGGISNIFLGKLKNWKNYLMWSLFPILHGFHEIFEYLELTSSRNNELVYFLIVIFGTASSFMLIGACIEFYGTIRTPIGKSLAISGTILFTLFYLIIPSKTFIDIYKMNNTIAGGIKYSYFELFYGFILGIFALGVFIYSYLRIDKNEMSYENKYISNETLVFFITVPLLFIIGISEGFEISIYQFHIIHLLLMILVLLIPLIFTGLINYMEIDPSHKIPIKESDNAIIVTKIDLSIIFVNKKFQRELKKHINSKRNFVGQKLNKQLLFRKYLVNSTHSLPNTLQGITKWVSDFEFENIDGSINHIQLIISKFTSEFFSWELKDITTHVEAEKEMIKLQKLEIMGTLAGSITHDFNNYLTIMNGNVSLLKKFNTQTQIGKYINNLEIAINQSVGIVRRLRTFSKGVTPSFQIVDIVTLIRETAQIFINKSDIEYSFSNHAEMKYIFADPDMINQVISNIILNAVDSLRGSDLKKISINIHNEKINTLKQEFTHLILDDENYINWVKIEIIDTGCGIPKKIIPKIFNPFFTTKHEGTGLGLSVSQVIVDKHDGFIKVNSEIGKSTTFTIWFPIKDIDIVWKNNE